MPLSPTIRILTAWEAALVVGVLLTGCAGPPPDRPVRLVLSNVHVEGYPTARGLEELRRLVAADPILADGIELDLQLAGVLGNEKEVLEKLRFGAIQMACVSVAPLAEFEEAMGVLTLPYLFEDADHMRRTLDGPVGGELLAALAQAGFVGLAWYEAGARSFYNRQRPVRRLADLAGLRIRVQKSEIMRATVEALGAAPVALGFKDVYTNLYSGAIDGAENNLPSYRSERHFEVARYYSYDRHSMIPDLVLMHRGTWQRLSAAEQAALLEAARASAAAQRGYWSAYVEEALALVLAAGSQVDEIEDPEAFRVAVEPVIAEFGGRYGDLVERIRAAAAPVEPSASP